MRILHVTDSIDPRKGGVSQAVKTITAGLNRLEVENEIVALEKAENSFIFQPDIKICFVGKGKTGWKYNNKLKTWLVENLSRFDVVIVHGIWLYHGFAVYKVIQSLRNKKLYHAETRVPRYYILPHGMLDPYFQKAPGRKLKAARNWMFWKIIEGKIVNAADAIFFTAETEKVLARKTFRPYYPKQEVVVGMGVEPTPEYNEAMRNSFLAKVGEIDLGEFFLFLGRIDSKKGVDLLLSAYELTRIELTGMKIPKLVIAGPGKESDFGKSILKRVEESEILRSSVLFPGMLTSDAKWGAFFGCELFVLPTHQENFGIAIVEAMACKKAVLTTNKTNIWKEIDLSGAGIITDDKLEDLISGLRKWVFLSNENKVQMSENAYIAYHRFFTIENVLINWHSLINDDLKASA